MKEILIPIIPLNLKEKNTNKEEKEKEWIEKSKDNTTENDSNAIITTEVTRLSPKRLENEIISECLSKEGSKTFTLLHKPSKIDLEKKDSKEESKNKEEYITNKIKNLYDYKSEKDDKHDKGEEENDDDDDLSLIHI